MSVKSSEIVSVLRREIEEFSSLSQTGTAGEVLLTGDGIARVYGLSDVMAGELVEIDIPDRAPVSAIALNLEEDNVGVVLLDEGSHVTEGCQVRCTGQVARVPAGDALLGRVVDPLGRPLDDGPAVQCDNLVPIERKGPGIIERENVDQPMYTGLKAIDALIPIGRGQRELIIGDRRTGKTAIAVDAIINQKPHFEAGEPVYCFYVAIGQKRSSVVRVVEKLRAHGAMEYTTVISATASDPVPMQYLAPYAGCAMAEHYRDSGRHALIIFDDLTKQAQAYRQISLLLRRPPGREAYPGDVFYCHSRLLERAARLSEAQGGGSLTALPIVETQAGDISAYIPTNVISITDGQIFLETHLFNSGLRPAINAGMSVSRVGGSAQIKAMKQTAGSLRLDLAQYRELASFSQFSSDLDKSTKAQLARGERLTEILKQKQYQPLDVVHQIMILYAGTHGYLDRYPTPKLRGYERHLFTFVDMKYDAFIKELRKTRELTENLDKQLKEILDDFNGYFNPEMTTDHIDAGLNLTLALAIGQATGPSRREMLQMIERATAKELISPSLEDELDKVLDEREKRDASKLDRFDHLVATCPILDIDEPLTLDELFHLASSKVASAVHSNEDAIFKSLMEREKSSSTALTPLFAVPHMVLEEEKRFAILAVRCGPGISFSTSAPDVHAIFFLIGSLDERAMHLQSLAAIAQIVNEPDFAQRWMDASGTDGLREIMLSPHRERADQ